MAIMPASAPARMAARTCADSALPPANTADPRDSFADAQTGVINAVSQTDLRILDVLGWTRVNGLDDHNQSNTAATTVLNVNNGVNGSIELQGDHDWFKVVLDPTKHYAITVEGAANGKGTLADLERIADGDATPLDFIDLGEQHEFNPEVQEGECSA